MGGMNNRYGAPQQGGGRGMGGGMMNDGYGGGNMGGGGGYGSYMGGGMR